MGDIIIGMGVNVKDAGAFDLVDLSSIGLNSFCRVRGLDSVPIPDVPRGFYLNNFDIDSIDDVVTIFSFDNQNCRVGRVYNNLNTDKI
jgi:hypothetical protein